MTSEMSVQVEVAAAVRDASARLTSGVAVITAAHDGTLLGTTVAAVIPLAEDPATVLVAMNKASSTLAGVLAARSFVVNILAEDQGWVARQFAGKGEKFTGIGFRTCSRTGAPILDGALASVSCVLDSDSDAGSHIALVGRGVGATTDEGRPLTYFRGSFGRWDRLREHDTYDQVRSLVLRREVPVGEDLVVAELAERLDARPDDVLNALVRLSTESLVERRGDGVFQPAPIRFELIESFYEARENIELGVIANHVGRIPADVLAHLSQVVRRMEELRDTLGPDPGELLSLHREVHSTLIAQSGSALLEESYRRLTIAWVWRSVWDEMDWKRLAGDRHLDDLVGALRDGDLTTAIQAVKSYHAEARALARIALERRGGSL